MSYYLRNLRILVGKIENTPGTMENLTSADFDVRIREPEITPIVEPDDEASKHANGHHGEDEMVMGAKSGTIAFAVRMTCGATPDVAPKWWKFAQGCGLVTKAWGSTGIGLYPRKEGDNKTMTIWVYDISRGANPTAVCYKFAGCMGAMTMGAEGIGQPWMANFEFTGKLNDIDMNVATGSILEMLAPDTTCADKMLSNSLTIGDTGAQISSFELDTGNEIEPQIDQGDHTGYEYFAITRRSPRLSINPLVNSAIPTWEDWTGGLTGCPSSVEIVLGNADNDKKYLLTIPKAQLISSAVAEREGLVNWDQNWKCLTNGTTGALADADLTPEDTFEILQGKRA